MASTRLESISSQGDQTLSRVRFVLHGASNVRDFASIMETGLKFVEGRPTISTNLVHAQDWTVNSEKQARSRGGGTILNEPGRVVVCTVSPSLHLGYGAFTTAYIYRAIKRVSGAPLRYASARKQLAFYLTADTESARERIEAEVFNGYGLGWRPEFNLEPQYILGSFDSAGGFEALVKQLDATIRLLEPIDYTWLEESLRRVFRLRVGADPALVPAMIRNIVVGTVESIIMSRLRMMRCQGLGLLGFVFEERGKLVEVAKVANIARQRQRIDEFGRRLASSSLFAAELAWLKPYATQQLGLMRGELDGGAFIG